MSSQTNNNSAFHDIRIKTTFAVAVVALVVITPFSINNFINARYIIGVSSAIIVFLFGINAWSCSKHNYQPKLIFWTLVPAISVFLVLALRNQGAYVAFWIYPALSSFYFMLPKQKAWLANVFLLLVVFIQAWYVLEPAYMIRFVMSCLGVSTFSMFSMHIITFQQEVLVKQAKTDPLTGLLNRMILNNVLEQAKSDNLTNHTEMSLIALDLDKFKKINDELGHLGGDKVLMGVAEFLKQSAKSKDKVFRTGGEEFLILLENTDANNAKIFAEKIREGIASLKLIPNGTVTVSIGVATYQPHESAENWMKRCDGKLYQAKHKGRNLVVS